VNCTRPFEPRHNAHAELLMSSPGWE
jgi:hypothetical protein